MKTIVRISLFLLIITSYVISQEINTYKGYSKIEFIDTVINDNPIITKDKFLKIVKSVGYNTLPNNIRLDLDLLEYFTNLSDEKSGSVQLFEINVNVLAFDDDPPHKRSGYLNVSLRGTNESELIETRIADSLIDASFNRGDIDEERVKFLKSDWDSEIIMYEMIGKSMIFRNYNDKDIIQQIRSYIQEIFDELNILIREYP